ncbi:helix-turn-helix domain-containing protein [Antarcticibacterium flavum]|uniref:Helix-turn-helix domain-containing protein n=1 Tax=Antarcticibacterium flavum TaxID=2058175 RepID=A0A5B7X2U2_9FLAO|nr:MULTISPECIES: helix-turn-helix domain-containing protein [Antarcticibacterium]MCM4161101.1 plasmid maintenance system antidote protein [Antarcticibacterium sp. W02-3]QCY69395.1 helix-turn-helix domain-containing protein [Antarcticibacterium flavum]
MDNFLNYKGIHPGKVLKRELDKRSLKQRPFALSINEHPQTLNAITKGKRNLNTALALKIEEKLGLEEGAMAILQTYYDIQKEKEKQVQETPDLSKLRKALFWDTDFNKINWQEKSKAVISRVYERGNGIEKEEITRFYGKEKVDAALGEDTRKPFSVSFKK